MLDFFERLMIAMPDLVTLSTATRENAMVLLAMTSLSETKYLRTKHNPEVIRDKAEELLALPRMQQALAIRLDEAGLSPESCMSIMSDIAHGKIRISRQVMTKEGLEELQSDVPIGDRLRAVDMAFRLTTGYAPTRAAVSLRNEQKGTFFDKDRFAKTPSIKTIDVEYTVNE